MAIINHSFVCTLPDNATHLAQGKVCGSHWNAALDFTGEAGDYAGIYEPANANIQSHIIDTSNPHSVTLAQLGGTTVHSALSNLTWSTAGHTIDTDVSWGGYNLIGIGEATIADLTINTQVLNQPDASIAFNLTPSLSASNNYITFAYTGFGELLRIDGDNKQIEVGQSGGVNMGIGGAALSTYRLLVKSGVDNGTPENIAVFQNSSSTDILSIGNSDVVCTPKLTVSTTGSKFTGNNKFGDLTFAPVFPVQGEVRDTGTNTAPFILTSYHTLSSGTAANGIGSTFAFVTVDNAGSARGSSYIEGCLENVATATPQGAFRFGTRDGNTITGFSVSGFEKLYIGNAGVQINRDKVAKIDFACHGDTVTNCFLVDASADQVIVNGHFKTQGGKIQKTTRVTSSPYNVLATDEIIYVDTDGGAITVNLPAGVEGTHYRIINCGTSANAVTVDGNGAETVHGSATQTLYDEESIDLNYNATEGWW